MATLERLANSQLSFPFVSQRKDEIDAPYAEKLKHLLRSNLDFQGKNGVYASHNFHAFPAKFPPQLPALFIERLTQPGDVVLDPMAGSGTTLVEAVLAERIGVGCDIDPLALMISKVKTTPLDPMLVGKAGYRIDRDAKQLLKKNSDTLWCIKAGWTPKTRDFVDYWFMPQTQLELLALSYVIDELEDASLHQFFRLIFSSIIITKSGGVSLARDLAHTRPHRAKVIYDSSGEVLEGMTLVAERNPRLPHISKTLSSPIKEFDKVLQKALDGVRRFSRLKD